MPEAEMEIQRTLGSIEGKVDILLKSFAEHVKDDAGNFKEINIRLAIHDKKLYTFMGAVGIIWIIVSAMFNHSDKLKLLFG